MISTICSGRLGAGYRRSVFIALMIILCGTFCFARAFSLQKLAVIFGVPLYITDVFILFALPLAWEGIKAMEPRVPMMFRGPFLAMFFFGMFYLILGVLVYRSEFALRGVVLSTYLLFLPLIWVVVERHFNGRIFCVILGVCNLIALVNGAIIINHWPVPWDGLPFHFAQMRTFNILLYSGIAIAFFLPYGMEKAKGFSRWALGALCGLNIALIVMSGLRTAWVEVICLVVFFFFVFRGRIKKLLTALVVIFIFILGFLLAQSFWESGRAQKPAYIERAAGTVLFLDEVLTSNHPPEQIPPERRVAYGNITWRLKIWKATWQAGKTSLIWGHGFRDVLIYDPSAIGRTSPVRGFAENSGITPPHNEFMTIFYKMGFLGLALFLWINGFVFVQGVKALERSGHASRRVYLAGALGSLVAWHAMAQSFDVIDSPPTNIFLWVLLGFVLVLVYGQKAVPEERGA